jgi:hypothetical protein
MIFEVRFSEVVSYVFFGILYFSGLILLAMPPGSIPWFDGTKNSVRLAKHALGLGFFMIGTMEIHDYVKDWAGYGFVLISTGLIICLALLRIYEEKF